MNEVMRDRGIVGWYWTYDTLTDMKKAVSNGFTGLTTNIADEYVSNSSTKYVFVKGDSNVKVVPVVGEQISVIGVTYNRIKEKINGKVFYVEDFGDKYAVIVSYSTDESRTDAPILYTQTYYINKENEIFEGLTK